MENSQGNQKPQWTWPEDKVFEEALVRLPDGTPERWRCIAEVLPGRSQEEVEQHYNDLVDDVSAIDAGIVPLPNYSPSGDVAAPMARGEVVRKKGRKWTEEEHMLFLQGLKQCGKGSWQKISRNILLTKTPTQIASHAQKYYNHQKREKKSRRPSIHDVTLPASNPNGGVSQGCQNAVGRFNQECMSGHDDSIPNTNHEPILLSYQISNHRGCPSGSYVTANGNNHRSSSLARFPDHEGSTGNHDPPNVYFEGASIGCNNGTMPRNEHSVLLSNQFPLENNNNMIDMDRHLISSQSQFVQQCAPMEFCTANLISRPTPLPAHFQNVDGHPGPQFPDGGGSMWHANESNANLLNNFRTVRAPDRSAFVGNDAKNNLNECSVLPYICLSGDQANANGTLPSASPTDPSI